MRSRAASRRDAGAKPEAPAPRHDEELGTYGAAMPRFNNSSTSVSVFVVCPDDAPGGTLDATQAIEVRPQGSFHFDTAARGMRRVSCTVFTIDPASTDAVMLWRGHVHHGDELKVDPEERTLRWEHVAITPGELEAVKALFPGDPNMADVTLDDLIAHARTRSPHGDRVAQDPLHLTGRQARDASAESECRLRTAGVVMDSIALLVGLGGVRAAYRQYMQQAAAQFGNLTIELLDPQAVRLSELPAATEPLSTAQKLVRDFSAQASNTDRALFVVDAALAAGKQVGSEVVRFIVEDLSLMDKLLYGALALAEIAAVFVSDGTALVLIAGIQVAIQSVLLVEDILLARDACMAAAPPPAPAPVVVPPAPRTHFYDGSYRIQAMDETRLVLVPLVGMIAYAAAAPATEPHTRADGTTVTVPYDMWNVRPVAGKDWTYTVEHAATGALLAADGSNLPFSLLLHGVDAAAAEAEAIKTHWRLLPLDFSFTGGSYARLESVAAPGKFLWQGGNGYAAMKPENVDFEPNWHWYLTDFDTGQVQSPNSD